MNSTGATQRFSANHKTRSEQKNRSSFISDQIHDWELMRKAMWKAIATLLFTAKCCSFSSPKRRPKNFVKQTIKINILFTKPNVGLESTQICLLNGSLKEFNKYIYRKAVDRELWRRNVLNTIIFPEWRPGTSRMTECKHKYMYRMTTARNFEDKTAFIPNTFYSRNKYRERTAGQRRGNTNIFTGWRHQEFWRQILPNKIYSRNKNDVLNLGIFQQAEIALARKRENFSFLKNSLAQIDSKLNSRPYGYLHIMPCNM